MLFYSELKRCFKKIGESAWLVPEGGNQVAINLTTFSKKEA